MQLSLSKGTPKYMLEFIDFCCQDLGLDKLRGDIIINFKRGALDGQSFGLTWGDSREVIIEIAGTQHGEKVSRQDKLQTVAHELTHAHQYLTHKMKNMEYVVSVVWEGKQVTSDKYFDTEMPWEVEAEEAEMRLYNKWSTGDYK